jgi:glutaconate CoA-transferase subunit A
MVARYVAGATGLPFYPLRSYAGTDLPRVNPKIRFVDDPYGTGEVAVVPPLTPELAILHAQRADVEGNAHLWGLVGAQMEVAFAADKVIVVVEEVVETSLIRSDPNRTLIPGLVVDAVVVEPFGAHPSYVQGYYDRDNAFYLQWDRVSRDEAATNDWLEEWVLSLPDRRAYLEKLGADAVQRLRPEPAPAAAVDYGAYA